MNRELLDETLKAIRRAGFEVHHIERNKHVKVIFYAQQRKHTIVLSNSPSCPFASRKNRAVLRRILRRQ